METPENVGEGCFWFPEDSDLVAWYYPLSQTHLDSETMVLITPVCAESLERLIIMQSLGPIGRNSGLVSAWENPHFEKVCSEVLVQSNKILKKTS